MNIVLACMGIVICIMCIANACYTYKELNYKLFAIQVILAIFCFVISILHLLH